VETITGLKKIDGGLIEGAAEECDADRVGVLFEFGLPVPRHRGVGVQLVQSLTVPNGALPDRKMRQVTVQRQRVGGVGLKFDRIRSGGVSGIDQSDGLIVIMVVIGRDLRNHIDGMAIADRTVVDSESHDAGEDNIWGICREPLMDTNKHGCFVRNR